MRFQALRNDPQAMEDALQFQSYLLQLGEGKLQSTGKKQSLLRSLSKSVETFTK